MRSDHWAILQILATESTLVSLGVSQREKLQENAKAGEYWVWILSQSSQTKRDNQRLTKWKRFFTVSKHWKNECLQQLCSNIYTFANVSKFRLILVNLANFGPKTFKVCMYILLKVLRFVVISFSCTWYMLFINICLEMFPPHLYQWESWRWVLTLRQRITQYWWFDIIFFK